MTVILIRILRVLLVLVLLRLALRLYADWRRNRARRSPPAPDPAKLVRDQECNTFLPQDRAFTATVAGQDEYFCSERCRDQALDRARAS